MKLVKVGRARENDIVLQDTSVSRYHLELFRDDEGHVFLTDLDSGNGTFVNGRKISGSVLLEDNDIVKAGNSVLPWKNYFKTSTSQPDIVIPAQEKTAAESDKKGMHFPLMISAISAALSLLLPYYSTSGKAYYSLISLIINLSGDEPVAALSGYAGLIAVSGIILSLVVALTIFSATPPGNKLPLRHFLPWLGLCVQGILTVLILTASTEEVDTATPILGAGYGLIILSLLVGGAILNRVFPTEREFYLQIEFIVIALLTFLFFSNLPMWFTIEHWSGHPGIIHLSGFTLMTSLIGGGNEYGGLIFRLIWLLLYGALFFTLVRYYFPGAATGKQLRPAFALWGIISALTVLFAGHESLGFAGVFNIKSEESNSGPGCWVFIIGVITLFLNSQVTARITPTQTPTR
jgi:hypothetical protein